MSKLTTILVIGIAILLNSCAPISYYQLLTTKTDDSMKQDGDNIVYEDNNCKIRYNLWSPYGTTKIIFENKTNEDIYLDLSSCFFFMNNCAYDMYDGSTSSKSISNSSTYGLGIFYGGIQYGAGNKVISNSTTTKTQHRIVTIPAGMYKLLEETDFVILKHIYRNCDLYLQPNKEAPRSAQFNNNNSPYKFGLRLSYYVGKSIDPIMIKNEFYVNSIANYNSKQFKKTEKDKSVCEDEKNVNHIVTIYPFYSPYSFFIKYNPANEGKVKGTSTIRKH